MSYGCFNRKPFVKEYQGIPFRMSPDCEYQKTDKYADPGCVGCIHKNTTWPLPVLSPNSAQMHTPSSLSQTRSGSIQG